MAIRLAWLICTWTVLGTLPSLPFLLLFISLFYYILFIYYFLVTIIFYYFTWNGPKMFVDLDWPTNASSPLSASDELLVFLTSHIALTAVVKVRICSPKMARKSEWTSLCALTVIEPVFFFKISLGFLGAMQIMQYISRTSYGKVSVCLAGWLSITAGIVSKRLNLS